MSNTTSVISENKARNRFVRWLSGRLRTAGNRLFAAEDLAALNHGWQIVSCCGGLGRLYRDPGFDTLAACPRCGGTARPDGRCCPECAGTGRVARPSPLCVGGGGEP